MGAASFRLNPGVGTCGSIFVLEVQGIARAADYEGKELVIEFFELDSGPIGKNQPMAEFTGGIENSGTKTKPDLAFAKIKRTDAYPAELPLPTARTSDQGEPLTFRPHWLVPHLILKFRLANGITEGFLVLIPSNATEKEGYSYEIGFRIKTAKEVQFDSSRFPAHLDCTKALAENCKQAALMSFNDHRELVRKRGVGNRYGSKYEPVDPSGFKGLQAKYGLKPAHCIGYLLEAGKLGHAMSLASGDWKGIASYLSEGKGTTLAKGLEKAGWTGIYYTLDTENPMDKGYRYNTPYFSWTDHGVTFGIAKKTRRYYELHVHDFLVNYNPTRKYWDGSPVEKPTQRDASKIARLKSIPFGILNARAGDHTAILLSGEVYEVHWNRGPDEEDLFAKCDFETEWKWPWLSGIIHVPPGLW